MLAITVLTGCSGRARTETAVEQTRSPARARDAGVRVDSGASVLLPAVTPKTEADAAPPDAAAPAATVTVDATEFVRFAAGSARLTRASRRALDRMVEMIKGSPEGGVIKVEGHCDRVEKKRAVLSLRRARQVKRYLVRKGVEGSRLKAVGYGSTRPVASSDTAEGRQQNRRVDFTFVEQTY
jgi:outer membrane protein OmpA-like peptidoglycan-associated protein